MTRLHNKTALVTGAGQGIGKGIAEILAAEGAAVLIAELNPETGSQTAQQLTENGHQAYFVQTDVTQEDDVLKAVQEAINRFGKLDILVNNAGRNLHYNAAKMTSDEWDAGITLNLKAAWLCSKYALQHMAARKSGVIINIASLHASMTLYNNFPYAAAKAGLLGMTRSLALDWGEHNIRVVSVSPGYVRTQPVLDGFVKSPDATAEEERVKNLHPLKRIGEPQDIGQLVAFLASDAASYITGVDFTIDGGLSARYAD